MNEHTQVFSFSENCLNELISNDLDMISNSDNNYNSLSSISDSILNSQKFYMSIYLFAKSNKNPNNLSSSEFYNDFSNDYLMIFP